MILFTWDPRPIDPPQLAPDINRMGHGQRVGEMLRFRILSWEYGLSRNGALRAFIRLCVLLGVVIAILAVVILPLVLWLVSIIKEILFSVLHCLLSIVAIIVVLAIIAGLFGVNLFHKTRRR